MVASPEPEETTGVAPPLLARGRKSRPRGELVVEAVFRPLAGLVVHVARPLRMSPVVLVLANAAAGLLAAAAIARGELLAAALLLQLKTVLDNADGQLARVTGRTTALGRYLDTEADLLVNAAVCAALGHATGSWPLALAAFAAVTIVLSVDFNEEALFRTARGEIVVTQPSAADEGAVARALAGVYRAVFAPQDRALQGLARRRLERMLADVSERDRRERATLAYFDGTMSAVLANLGLSTQLAALGVCLVVGEPAAYLWLALGAAALLPVLQLHREARAKRVARS